ncbi:M15 family metallopeptidase [Shewanella sp. UCD-KL12]|uniref:M15 family metallopeptidase n=1 Tax=Shewanella sp. UCD-KL12 TaxID=1917163 RepID=UPI000970D6D6|nr:M15 family metallopeptidase [Shewanella sp. UCD-KL12]
MLNPLTAYGLDSSALIEHQGHKLESHTAAALSQMTAAAVTAGIDIQICSGYRDFDRQMHIWNNKANGLRPVLDLESKPVDISEKSADEIIDLILLWSALPGTSRHHWGTDVDLFDGNQITQSQLQLISAEYDKDGPCSALHQWLVLNASKYGFYFPFQLGLSGVSPEPWHLSYFPVANNILSGFDIHVLKQAISNSDIRFKSELLARLEPLVNHYVFKVAPSPSGVTQVL